ncbi:MAG: Uncharacterized MFS-type transporter, partial [uncultured Pseudonocardia sp.]
EPVHPHYPPRPGVVDRDRPDRRHPAQGDRRRRPAARRGGDRPRDPPDPAAAGGPAPPPAVPRPAGPARAAGPGAARVRGLRGGQRGRDAADPARHRPARAGPRDRVGDAGRDRALRRLQRRRHAGLLPRREPRGPVGPPRPAAGDRRRGDRLRGGLRAVRRGRSGDRGAAGGVRAGRLRDRLRGDRGARRRRRPRPGGTARLGVRPARDGAGGRERRRVGGGGPALHGGVAGDGVRLPRRLDAARARAAGAGPALRSTAPAL